MAEIFRRIEKKYVVNDKQYEIIKDILIKYMDEDSHGKSTICNVYFDTENYDLIRHSIEKPYYKDKVRLRSYNIPKDESTVFLEIKRKCDKVVGKRRIEMKLKEFNKYLENPNSLIHANKQIKTELDYYFKLYNLKPTMYISYSRTAYYQKDNLDFRVTFDSNIKARGYDLNLELGSYGSDILDKNKYVMEIKTLGSIPLWFVKLLTEFGIKQASYSKYGTAYEELVLKENFNMPRACVG